MLLPDLLCPSHSSAWLAQSRPCATLPAKSVLEHLWVRIICNVCGSSLLTYCSVGDPKAKPLTLLVPASTQRLFTLRECVDCIPCHLNPSVRQRNYLLNPLRLMEVPRVRTVVREYCCILRLSIPFLTVCNSEEKLFEEEANSVWQRQ